MSVTRIELLFFLFRNWSYMWVLSRNIYFMWIIKAVFVYPHDYIEYKVNMKYIPICIRKSPHYIWIYESINYTVELKYFSRYLCMYVCDHGQFGLFVQPPVCKTKQESKHQSFCITGSLWGEPTGGTNYHKRPVMWKAFPKNVFPWSIGNIIKIIHIAFPKPTHISLEVCVHTCQYIPQCDICNILTQM